MANSGERNICFCNSNIPWGGGEAWHFNAARSLAARGWRVFLICRPDGELFARAKDEPGLELVPMTLSRFSFLNPLVHIRLKGFFRKQAVRALIMNLPADLKAAGPAAKAAGVRHVIYRRGSALPVRDSLLNRRLYGEVISRLIVNSSATMRQALAANPNLLPKERISILPNGFDVSAFDRDLAQARAAGGFFPDGFFTGDAAGGSFAPGAELPFTPGAERPFILGTAGRLNRQKAQHLLLRLGARLAAAGLDFRLVIAGRGEREGELKKLARDLGLAERTLFPGFLTDPAPFWNAIDLFVLPSLWEGFGNVVIEAGLARKPVFAFAVSNLPDLVLDGVNGRLFPLPHEERANSPEPGPHNPPGREPPLAAMAGAVRELAANREKLAAMGEQGRRLALAYSQEACMDALEEWLK